MFVLICANTIKTAKIPFTLIQSHPDFSEVVLHVERAVLQVIGSSDTIIITPRILMEFDIHSRHPNQDRFF